MRLRACSLEKMVFVSKYVQYSPFEILPSPSVSSFSIPCQNTSMSATASPAFSVKKPRPRHLATFAASAFSMKPDLSSSRMLSKVHSSVDRISAFSSPMLATSVEAPEVTGVTVSKGLCIDSKGRHPNAQPNEKRTQYHADDICIQYGISINHIICIGTGPLATLEILLNAKASRWWDAPSSCKIFLMIHLHCLVECCRAGRASHPTGGARSATPAPGSRRHRLPRAPTPLAAHDCSVAVPRDRSVGSAERERTIPGRRWERAAASHQHVASRQTYARGAPAALVSGSDDTHRAASAAHTLGRRRSHCASRGHSAQGACSARPQRRPLRPRHGGSR